VRWGAAGGADNARAAGNEDFHINIISLNNLIHHV